MRIGILTFHCAHNYGAILQCYALQEYLKSLGHEVSVIDYRPAYLVRRYAVFSRRYWISRNVGKAIMKLLTEPYLIRIRVKRHRKMESSIKEMLHLCPYPVRDGTFDVVILGSDQIWNPQLTGKKYDEVYFGVGLNCKKIVYAASNRSISLNNDEKEFYKRQFAKLDWISVRESTFQSLLSPLTDKRVFLNIDPTLLSDTWAEKLDLHNPKTENYVMLYEVNRHKKNRKLAMSYAAQRNLCFVELIDSLAISYQRNKFVDQFASPKEFLGYIRYSKFVFTTSFHGVSLSILFKKDFYYIRQHNSADYRIESLLNLLGISDRMIEQDAKPVDTPIDYIVVRDKLKELRNNSVQYINNALQQ